MNCEETAFNFRPESPWQDSANDSTSRLQRHIFLAANSYPKAIMRTGRGFPRQRREQGQGNVHGYQTHLLLRHVRSISQQRRALAVL